jgi:hypothetical protein
MQWLCNRWPGRIKVLEFERLCENVDAEFTAIAEFFGVAPEDSARAQFRSIISVPKCAPEELDLAQFDPRDLSYICETGYRITQY